MRVRPRLSLSGAGLGAGLTIGPIRITRSARGRLSVGLALPRGRTLRGRVPSGAVAPGAVGRLGPWAPPQGPRLAGPREGA